LFGRVAHIQRVHATAAQATGRGPRDQGFDTNMRKTTLLSTLAIGATLAFATLSANAQDKGFYAGAGVGQSFVDEGRYDDHDTAFSAFGGYQFNKYFALEGGYVDFGEIEADVAGPSFEGDSTYISAVGTLPLNDRFAVYAKAGIHRWNLDTSLPALTGTADDNNTDPTYGVGAQYRFNDRFSMRTGYDRFEVGDLDVDLVQVQGIYRF